PPVPSTAGTTGAAGTGSPSQSQQGTPSPGTSGPAAPPTPERTGGAGRPATVEQLTGLCRAYLAKPAGQRAKALESAAFADLVAAAGGAGQVEAYCTRLAPEPGPKASPSARTTRSPAAENPATPAHSTGRPSTAR
ncbi:hypothetical protein ACWEVO_36885, partial [Micromonospora sp. NPDC003776]